MSTDYVPATDALTFESSGLSCNTHTPLTRIHTAGTTSGDGTYSSCDHISSLHTRAVVAFASDQQGLDSIKMKIKYSPLPPSQPNGVAHLPKSRIRATGGKKTPTQANMPRKKKRVSATKSEPKRCGGGGGTPNTRQWARAVRLSSTDVRRPGAAPARGREVRARYTSA